VRTTRVFKRLLGVEYTVIESVELVEDERRGEEVLLARVQPVRSRRSRCSRCERRCRGYDGGDGRRRLSKRKSSLVIAAHQLDASCRRIALYWRHP